MLSLAMVCQGRWFCLLVIHITCNLVHVYLCLSGVILVGFNLWCFCLVIVGHVSILIPAYFA
jgi:hypothetical protein